jgi:hypothetical protein
MRAPRSWHGLREISIIRDRLCDARRQPRLFISDCYQPSLSGNAPTEGLFRYHINKQHATIDKHVGHDEPVVELGSPEREQVSTRPWPASSTRLMSELEAIAS